MTLKLRHTAPLLIVLAAVACSRTAPPAPPASKASPPAAAAAALPPVEPPAPGTPGGLPDDRTPVSEAPFTPESAQGAADVVQTYFAHLGQEDYEQAWKLWSDGGKASGSATAAAFERSFDRYAQYNAQVGAPGRIEGAAGSSYVDVPVVIYGRLKTGEEVHEKGKATLRRVNGVPGATEEQLTWRITAIASLPSWGGTGSPKASQGGKVQAGVGRDVIGAVSGGSPPGRHLPTLAPPAPVPAH